jgi:histidinol-phosphate phosphatase family protein
MDKVIVLDRDGTLTKDQHGYTYKTEDFELLPGVIEGLKKLSKEFIFVIITNQSGIGRGIHTEKDMHKFNQKLVNELKKENIEIKKIYHCPHTPEQSCDCRKPSIKYIKEAEKEFSIDLKNSWVIGDHPHDIDMGIKAGCKNIYLLTGHGKKHFDELKKNNIKPNYVAENFSEVTEFIIKNEKCQK